MILFRHEMKRGKIALLLWSAGLSFMLGICILIYPEMAGQMNELSTMFSDMGSFTAAFGMDQLNFGEFKGYFGIECGNILGIGGALFAGLLGIGALAKEEKDHTAEFLLTHPISRSQICKEKLLAVFVQIIILNIIVAAITIGTTLLIGETLPRKEAILLLLSFLLMQIQIAGITYGISAFLSNGALGVGIGLALLFYFLNLISNLVEAGKFLKYITPFAYADSPQILGNGSYEGSYIITGLIIMVLSIGAGWINYSKKDIA